MVGSARGTLRAAFLIALCLGVATQARAEVSARVDRAQIALDESFTLILERSGESGQEPDLSVLGADFEVLGSSRSSSIQILNGQYSATEQWSLTLMARRAGRLVIPPIPVGGESSQPVTIDVRPPAVGAAGAMGDFHLEAEIEPVRAYVQSQVVYTVRFFQAAYVRNASLSEPQLPGAVIEKLGEDTRYETQRDGRPYSVIERRYAIFPQQSGEFRVDPVVFEGQVVDLRRRASIKRLQSNSLALEVLPTPAEFGGSNWLPAIGVELSEGWSEEPPEFVVGEPLTRTVTLRAEGLLSSQLAEFPIATPPEVKAYPDQPTTSDRLGAAGVIGTRQQKTALIPTDAGRYTLPAVEVPWWNTRSNRREVARLPARTITVRMPAGAAPPPLVAAETPLAVSGSEQDTSASAVGAGWIVATALLGFGWLATLALWFFTRRQADAAPPPGEELPAATGPALKALKGACRENDAPAARTALLAWGAARWPRVPPRSVGEIGRRLGGEAEERLETLCAALYAPQAPAWRSESLYSTLR